MSEPLFALSGLGIAFGKANKAQVSLEESNIIALQPYSELSAWHVSLHSSAEWLYVKLSFKINPVELCQTFVVGPFQMNEPEVLFVWNTINYANDVF